MLFGTDTQLYRSAANTLSLGSDDSLKLGDSSKIKLGDSNDLQLYHDGSHSIIHDNGTGDLHVRGNVVRIKNAAGTENMASFVQDGEVALAHNNATKLTTTSTGVSVNSGSVVNSANSEVDIQLPDEGGLAMGAAYTYANVYGKSGDLHLRANSYPANTGSTSKIYLSTSTSSGGQAGHVII